jgi:SAM-dependent methyltransferase
VSFEIKTLPYTFGYFPEQAPAMLRLALLGYSASPTSTGPFRYLELGFGQGVSFNIHAAANPGEFWGVDLSADHVVHASDLAQAAGLDATLIESSFEDFANRPDVPQFDVISAHGIWTWVTDSARKAMVEIVRKRLKPGGLFHISYNCLPGQGLMAPIRQLFKTYVERHGSRADSLDDRVKQWSELCGKLMDANPLFFANNPKAKSTIERFEKGDARYVFHELLSEDWLITSYPEVAGILAEAALTFGGSTDTLELVDSINLSDKGSKMLSAIGDPLLREYTRDLFLNRQFRRDIYVKGLRRLTQPEQVERFAQIPFTLVRHPQAIDMNVTGAQRKAPLKPEVYDPILKAMAADNYRPKTPVEILKLSKGGSANDLNMCLMVLVGKGDARPAIAPDPSSGVYERAAALNAEIIRRSHSSADISVLASPVTGSGVTVSPLDQIYLNAAKENGHKAADIVKGVRQTLYAKGRWAVRNQKKIEDGDDLVADVSKFANEAMPVLKALKVF